MALFTILLFTKSFHWLADDRIDYVCGNSGGGGGSSSSNSNSSSI